ncbi:MAG: HIT family protein [Planctomycetota bacterium]
MATIFTKIIQGEIPGHKVWEDEDHVAFLDLFPVRPGHTLVVPKKETGYIFDLDAGEHAALWTAAHTVARRLKERLGCARICVAVIGYEVPHAHVHLVPTNETAEFPWAPGAQADQADLAAIAAKLR